jgi:glutamate-1-semialdehyde 2,1-aminomutase
MVKYGQGPYLFDVDGNRYVDYINSWGPLVLGHAHPAVPASARVMSLSPSSPRWFVDCSLR